MWCIVHNVLVTFQKRKQINVEDYNVKVTLCIRKNLVMK